jgi:MFS family permease
MENSSQPASLVYAWYVVAILTLAYVFSFIDRQIIGLLVGPIKKDLSISDVQISYLMGVSFALFYTFFGIPLGWLADRFSRRLLIAIGVTIWSLMTAGCGLCNQFWQLALMRMGVGVGEAALSPAAYSLIADYFPPHRRATAMSVYTMGIYVGSGLALVLGGQIIRLASGQDQYQLAVLGSVTPWQLVFICVGLPGILVALLFLTIREPERSKSRLGASASSTWKETLGYLWSNRATLIFLNVGVALVAMSSYANMSWIPEMFSRRYGWATAYTGLIFGAIMSICGVIGVVGGGWLSDRWLQQGYQDAPLRVAFWLAQ